MLLLPKKDNPLLLPANNNISKVNNCRLIFIGSKNIDLEDAEKYESSYIYYKKYSYYQKRSKLRLQNNNEPKGKTSLDMDNTVDINDFKRAKIIDNTCYCFNCKKLVDPDVSSYMIKNNNGSFRSPRLSSYGCHTLEKIFTCPHCHYSIAQRDIKMVDHEYAIHRTTFLDGNKLKIKTKSIVYRCVENKFFIEERKGLSTMNLETGYTYNFPVIKNGHRPKKGHIVNSTYSGFSQVGERAISYSNKCKELEEFYEEIYNHIRDYKMNKLDLYLPTFEEYNNKINKINNDDYFFNSYSCMDQYLTCFNRYPTATKDFIRNYIKNNYMYDRKDFIKFRKELKQECKDPTKALLEHYNIPATKRNKNAFNENYQFIKVYKLLCNILSPDNLYKVICANINETTAKALSKFLHRANLNKQHLNNFINKIQKEKKSYIISDTIHMLNDIMDLEPDYKLRLNMPLKDLHDLLSSDYRKLKYKNIAIPYEEEELKLNGKFDDLVFTVAKDTHELLDVGANMNICVGSYGNRAVAKDCTIVIARDAETHENVICIELNDKVVRQTKLKYNNYPDDIQVKTLFKWFRANNLSINTYDIRQDLVDMYNSDLDVEKMNFNNDVVLGSEEAIEVVAVPERQIEYLRAF